jgi:hypothetical protein
MKRAGEKIALPDRNCGTVDLSENGYSLVYLFDYRRPDEDGVQLFPSQFGYGHICFEAVNLPPVGCGEEMFISPVISLGIDDVFRQQYHASAGGEDGNPSVLSFSAVPPACNRQKLGHCRAFASGMITRQRSQALRQADGDGGNLEAVNDNRCSAKSPCSARTRFSYYSRERRELLVAGFDIDAGHCRTQPLRYLGDDAGSL